ncbi:MAG: hypothetical protein IT203_05540 [Fimbriimonadaceae bacterium]|nr:hypothetical protein [Fimbriimonadaceae bacterium]
MSERHDLIPPAQNVVESFEAACKELGLRVHRGSLEKYEECTHWHITIPKQKGTLEATWWPTNHALWLDVRTNRKSEWMPAVIKSLAERF